MPHYRNDHEILGLQILKFLCALLVVQIHFSSGIRSLVLPIAQMAVPIFFIITGYFLPDAYGNIEKERLKKTFFKILKLEIIFTLIYLAYFLLTCLTHPHLFSVITRPQYWLKLLLIGGSGQSGHLWYLMALLQAILIILVAVRMKILKWLYWLIPLGIITNLMFGNYNFLADNTLPNRLVLSRNVLTTALPCLLIGTLIRYYEYRLPSQSRIMAMAFIGFLGIYIETYILERFFPFKVGEILIFTIPLATAVFIIFLRLAVKGGVGKRLAQYGRVYSMDIYLWHMIVGSVILLLLHRSGLLGIDTIDALIVIMSTILFAVLLNRLRLRTYPIKKRRDN